VPIDERGGLLEMSDFDEAAFRRRIREYVSAHAPDLPYRTGTRSPEDAEESKVLRDWSAQLYAAGFFGADWPTEFGGRDDYEAVEEFLVTEELASARVPIPIGSGGLAAHALIHFGTDDQRRRYLPPIRSYEHVWCQLFSEPDAGSDLAGMRTTALRDGDHYVVNGQKVWSTNAAFSDMGYLLARTDPSASKHAGISAFALDMSLPGITVRPLREMTGTSDFNEVFFDDVRVPADELIGPENGGWRIANESLASERAGVGALVIRLRQNLDALIEYAKTTPSGAGVLGDDPVVRQRLAEFTARVEIATLVSQGAMRRRLRGEFREMDVPLTKLGFAVLNYDLADFGLSVQGMRGTLATDAPEAVGDGRWQDELLYAKAYTISGGSNEIMRNLLGERALGLPREPKVGTG
jgi:alkylation response protein AidB-like acyl-CoA dehydrogenase